MIKNISQLLIFNIFLEIVFPGCSSSSKSLKQQQRWYAFDFELLNTAEKNSLEFVNEHLKATFSVNDTVVTVVLSNMTNHSLYVHYQRAMIGINNKYYPVVFSENDLFSSTTLIVPRNGLIETSIAPLRTLSGKKLQPFFKNTDYADVKKRKEILNQFGATITLILPMTINGTEVEQTFVLKVKKIRSSFVQENLFVNSREKKSSSHKTLIPIAVVAAITGTILYLNIKNQKPGQ